MRLFVLAAALLLAGCATTETGLAPAPKMPDLPPSLNEKAERLPDLTDPTMGGLIIDGTETDKKYNEVAWRLNTLIDVYNCVKESLETRKDASQCLNAGN